MSDVLPHPLGRPSCDRRLAGFTTCIAVWATEENHKGAEDISSAPFLQFLSRSRSGRRFFIFLVFGVPRRRFSDRAPVTQLVDFNGSRWRGTQLASQHPGSAGFRKSNSARSAPARHPHFATTVHRLALSLDVLERKSARGPLAIEWQPVIASITRLKSPSNA